MSLNGNGKLLAGSTGKVKLMTALVEIRDLKKYFPTGRGLFRRSKEMVRAVDGVTFDIEKGSTLGLVGESGCGKTTLGRLCLRLLEPTAGKVFFNGHELSNLDDRSMRELRRRMQIVFQDPLASLNPRKTVHQIVAAPYLIHKTIKRDEIDGKVAELLDLVGLAPAQLFIDRYPHELSGGQRQRVGVARAIALDPDFIVADEPVASLDMSIRAQILILLKKLKKRLGLTSLFITHDLSVVRSMADNVAVMYVGKIVELAEVTELYENPLHPYTKAILAATPIPNPRKARQQKKTILSGDPPSPINPPEGCRFHTRCPEGRSDCSKTEPDLTEVKKDHFVACHRYTGK